MQMIGARNDDVGMIADGGLLDGQFPGWPAGQRQIERIRLESGQNRGAIADLQADFDRRVRTSESAQDLRCKILGGAHHTHRHTPTVEAAQRCERIVTLGQCLLDA
jgi:hypothetical protein